MWRKSGHLVDMPVFPRIGQGNSGHAETPGGPGGWADGNGAMVRAAGGQSDSVPHHSAMNNAIDWVIFFSEVRLTASSKPWIARDFGP